MLNDISTLGIETDTDTPYCARAKLDTGPLCNYNCWFCYYQGDLAKTTALDTILKRVDYLVECGIEQVDLSGGESSLHPNWFDILDYCKNKGLRISTLSNGYKFSDREFITKSQEHGLEEILFSVHGFDKDSHNNIVGHRHGFDKIIQAIYHARDLGLRVRINCVVTKENYKNLSTDFVNLMLELKPMQVNFLTLNFWGNIKTLKIVPYGDVTAEIKKSIDYLKDHVRYLNVRYTPYCYMQGYEKYVCNTFQHIYDLYDWNMAVYNGEIDPKEYKRDNLKALYDSAANDRIRSYKKTTECVQCRYFYICDGIEHKVKDPIFPIAGDKIKQVNFFRQGFYED